MEAQTFQRDCLSCAISCNPCVFCGPLIRIGPGISAATYVCQVTSPEEVTAMRTQRKKILIVDNDEAVLIALERALEEQGYETVTAWNLPEGVELMEAATFDALLVGDHPPEFNCERLLKELRRYNIWTPCVVMHSAARHPFSEQYLQYLGAHGVACKWNDKEVLEEVRRCMADLHVAA
ncbi:MAG: response regulator [Burkholderiales bacterium]